ncbi:hypothetical protein CKA32_005887 [Geitlerinema sp. FC II]|nr:hypothetical protein CKA32_005887 [Geitlerinema sp. FC II]
MFVSALSPSLAIPFSRYRIVRGMHRNSPPLHHQPSLLAMVGALRRILVGGVHWRCVTIYRSHDRHPIFQVTHPTTSG